jgi:hypothetical protein
MRQRYDASSKWLIETQAGAILRLAGIGPVVSWRPLPGEVVQARQLPDGLVEATLAGRPDPVLFLIEVNTYPDNRVPGELLDDAALTYLSRRVVPEVIALTLCPKGTVRIAPDLRVSSALGTAALTGAWRVVELWTLPAAAFLPLTDPGLAPWLLLTQYDGPPEPLIQQCKDVIEANTTGGTRANLLAVTEILGGLRYDERTLQAILRRGGKMIESPVLQRWLRESKVEALQGVVLKTISTRFPPLPADVSAAVRLVEDEDRLQTLIDAAYTADSLAAFRTHLTTPAS